MSPVLLLLFILFVYEIFRWLNTIMFTAVHKQEVRLLITRLRASAKKRGITFNLVESDLDEVGFPINCPIFGVPMRFHRGKPENNSYSIDRIDSSLGYEPGNIVIISYRANKLKSDATVRELQLIADFYKNLGQ